MKSLTSALTEQLSWLRGLWQYLAVGLAMLSAILLPLNLLSSQRLHHDEALYATWALQIVSGIDPWLSDTPIDKPPLFLYTVAGAIRLLGLNETTVRLPSLVATVLTVLFTFGLGQALYGKGSGVLAAWLVALSPFSLLFAPTAFTDPMLVMLVLGACWAAIYRRAGWAGVCTGLAIATKQQGTFFVPLVIMFLVAGRRWQAEAEDSPRAAPSRRWVASSSALDVPVGAALLAFTISLFLSLLPALIWDIMRNQPSGFFEQSLSNYGGLSTDFDSFSERWAGFVGLLYYGTASPILTRIFLLGAPILLLFGIWRTVNSKWRSKRIGQVNPILTSISPRIPAPPVAVQADWLLAAFSLAFLLLHTLFSFQIWDRYLLGLIPLLALFLARVLLLPWEIFKNHWPNHYRTYRPFIDPFIGLALAILLAVTLSAPVRDAINGRYPLGSNSQALHGITQITAYLQGNVGANNTLNHRWLGTHWRFYLWRYPYDLQFWNSPLDLAGKARPGQLIAHPTWRSDTELRLALFEAGLSLTELARAYAPSGSPTIILYRIDTLPILNFH